MNHVLRPGSDPTFSITDALNGVPRCVLILEAAVRRVLSDFWDEDVRVKTRDYVRSLTAGCKVCGFRETGGVLRSMESLLSLPQESTVGIQLSITERLLELVELLKAISNRLTN